MIRFPVDAGGFDRLQSTNGALWGSSAGLSCSLWCVFDGDANASGISKIVDDTTKAVFEIVREAAGDGGKVYFQATEDNGSTVTTIGSAFAVPQGELVGLACRVVNGARKVWMWRASTGTVLVASDTNAYTGTPSGTTIWRIGNAAANPIALLMQEFCLCGGSAGVPSEAALQAMLTGKQRAQRALGSAVRWVLPLDQTSADGLTEVDDADTGLDDPVSPEYTTTVEGTTALTWDATDAGLDADLLAPVDTLTIDAAGTTATVVWSPGNGVGTVAATTDWTKKGYVTLGDGSDGGYDRGHLDPDGPDSIGESSGDVTGAWGFAATAFSGEAVTYTFEEAGLWSDDSTPDAFRNAAQTALSAGTTNSSTATKGDRLTRFLGAPIVASATPHDRPVAGGSTPVNVMAMDEWAGIQAVRFRWFESDGTTPLAVPFTPHGGSESEATTHTMSASAWVQPLDYMGSAEYAECWGGVLDTSSMADATQVKWTWEAQTLDGVWHTADVDGVSWPKKSILVHTDPLVIHVSNSGNDTTGDGSSGNPYATLQATALVTAVRGASKPVEIHHAAGTYTIGTADFRPGGTGSPHAHLITLRPAAGLDATDVTYNNTGMGSSALRRGNFNLRGVTFDMSSTVYGWVTTGADEDDERCCQEGVVYDDGGATKGDGERGLGIDGDNIWAVACVQDGKWRGFALNSFDPGSGARGVLDPIIFDYEMTNSGTFFQGVCHGGLIARCYIHGNALDASYPGDQHFDCIHFTPGSAGVIQRRTVVAYMKVEGNGDPAGGDSGYAYNFCLCNGAQVGLGLSFYIRNDLDSQPGVQLEDQTDNFQMAFCVERSSVNFIRDDGVGDDEVGRRVLVQNCLLGSVGSHRDKLRDMPERVLGGNGILDTGGYNDQAELDGSGLSAGSDPDDWGISYDTTTPANSDYAPSGSGLSSTVTARPTGFRFDFNGRPINRAAPVSIGAVQASASSRRRRVVMAVVAGAA